MTDLGHGDRSERLLSWHVLKGAAPLVWTAVLLIWAANAAVAQETNDDEDLEHATGAIFLPPEEIAKIPPAPLRRAFLPELVDISKRMPAVGNQGKLGSCVSWAVGYAARSYYSKLQRGGRLTRASIPSPYYMHGILRIPDPDGDWVCDGGAYIRDAIRLLSGEGAASLSEVPYTDRSCESPSVSLREAIKAERRFSVEPGKTIVVREPSDLDKIKTELANGHPVITSISTDKAFDRLRGRQIWSATGQPRSGHAITLVGYKESGQYFKFINSWGTNWGDRGYGRLSYDALLRGKRWSNESGMHRVDTVAYTLRVPGVTPPRPEPWPEPEPDPIDGKIELPKVSCGHLEQRRVDGQHTIIGFVREQEDLDKIREAVGARDIELDVALRPWPQCEALITMQEPLADPDKPSIELPKSVYKEGDTLSFSAGMAPFEGYLHVAYVQADGNVVNLVQQKKTGLWTLDQGTTLTFGDGNEGRAKFVVSEPFGKEMIIVIASASPLFPEPRPTVEVERTFLTALRKAILARPDKDLPERRISATFATLETKGDTP